MKRKFPLIVLVIAVLTATGAIVADSPTGDDSRATAPQQTAGYMIHIDPATGNVVDAAPGTAPLVLDAGLQNALSASSEGLEEVPSPVAGGGTMVDLQGRFQNTMIATVDENGEVKAPCLTELLDSGKPDKDETAGGGDAR